LGVIADSKAVTVHDAGFEEEFGVKGLVYDRMRRFGDEVCEEDWLFLAAGKIDGYLAALVDQEAALRG
jgi:hypothetical protein